jgi:hypothetical protein
MCESIVGCLAIVALNVGIYKLYEWCYLAEEREYYRRRWEQNHSGSTENESSQ